MNYNFFYSKSGKEEFLEGTYLGKNETNASEKAGDSSSYWGDCGFGKVYLRKVATSDFYVEPFLKGKIKDVPIHDNQAPPKKDSTKVIITDTLVKTKPVNKPVVKNKPVPKKPNIGGIVGNNAPKKPTISKPIVANKQPVTKPVIAPVITPPVKQPMDTIEKVNQPVVKNTNKEIIPTPTILKERSNELVKTLIVNSREVTVKFYDNGEIDGDTITVYFDKKVVLASKGLTAAPLTINLKVDDDDSEHELIMTADNLGRIPPNTSLMIVEAGDQRFEVRITSTEQKNALVRFRYQPSK